MKPNNDPDALPAGHDYDDVPADEAFVQAIMRRVERHRRRRQLVVGATCSFAGLIACAALVVLPAPAMPRLAMDVFNILASLLLAALCGLAWIASEDTPSA